jgi:hypothetical protein
MTASTKPTTTDTGAPVASDEHSLTIGADGPIVLNDHHLIEQTANFNRERIPERQPHRFRLVEREVPEPLEWSERRLPVTEIATVLLPSEQLDRAWILRGGRVPDREGRRAREQRDEQASAS